MLQRKKITSPPNEWRNIPISSQVCINVTGEIGWLLKRIFWLCLQIDHDVTRGVKPKQMYTLYYKYFGVKQFL